MWWPGWQTQLLNELGVPDTPQNQAFLQQWAVQEEPSASAGYAYNPLNVEQGTGAPVNFGSAAEGIQATANFLEHGYGAIINDLRSGNPTNSYPGVSSDLSSWSGGGYNGIHGFGNGSSVGGSTPLPGISILPGVTVNPLGGGELGPNGTPLAGSSANGQVPDWLAALLQPFSEWWTAHPIGLLLIALGVLVIGIVVISTDKNVGGTIKNLTPNAPVPVPV